MSSPRKHKHDCAAIVDAVTVPLGWRVVDEGVSGSGHLYWKVRKSGITVKLIAAKTTGSGTALPNWKAAIKRQLREADARRRTRGERLAHRASRR